LKCEWHEIYNTWNHEIFSQLFPRFYRIFFPSLLVSTLYPAKLFLPFKFKFIIQICSLLMSAEIFSRNFISSVMNKEFSFPLFTNRSKYKHWKRTNEQIKNSNLIFLHVLNLTFFLKVLKLFFLLFGKDGKVSRKEVFFWLLLSGFQISFRF
jgi:hypothetical protein